MALNLQEKCAAYWPERKGSTMQSNGITVTNLDVQTWPGYTATTLRLQKVMIHCNLYYCSFWQSSEGNHQKSGVKLIKLFLGEMLVMMASLHFPIYITVMVIIPG